MEVPTSNVPGRGPSTPGAVVDVVMIDVVGGPTYREMVRLAKLYPSDEEVLGRRDELIRRLRIGGWALQDLAEGARISPRAVAKICHPSAYSD